MKIFISYARADKDTAEKYVKAFERAGHSVFWDFEIPPGSSWSDHIYSQLIGADRVLVLWSKSSVASDFVKEEARRARDEKRLLPVSIDETRIPFGFGELQTVQMTGWTGSINDERWQLLMRSIASVSQNVESQVQPATQQQPRTSPAPPNIGFSGLAAVALCALLIAVVVTSIWPALLGN